MAKLNERSAAKQGWTREVQHPESQAMSSRQPFHSAPQPNCRFNADANTGHAFGIFMASVGALRASRYGAG